jgi:predicted nucleic-acid-binding Zn-ribbon protein
MKCSQCGGTKFLDIQVSFGGCNAFSGDGVEYPRTADSFVCEKCGHIELFIEKATLTAYYEKVKQDKELEQAQKIYNQERKKLQGEITRLEILIKDENQTVKTIKDAKEQLNRLQNELRLMSLRPPRHNMFH